MTFFPYTVACLQLCACITYASRGNWRLAIVWFGVALSNAALAEVKG